MRKSILLLLITLSLILGAMNVLAVESTCAYDPSAENYTAMAMNRSGTILGKEGEWNLSFNVTLSATSPNSVNNGTLYFVGLDGTSTEWGHDLNLSGEAANKTIYSFEINVDDLTDQDGFFKLIVWNSSSISTAVDGKIELFNCGVYTTINSTSISGASAGATVASSTVYTDKTMGNRTFSIVSTSEQIRRATLVIGQNEWNMSTVSGIATDTGGLNQTNFSISLYQDDIPELTYDQIYVTYYDTDNEYSTSTDALATYVTFDWEAGGPGGFLEFREQVRAGKKGKSNIIIFAVLAILLYYGFKKR